MESLVLLLRLDKVWTRDSMRHEPTILLTQSPVLHILYMTGTRSLLSVE